MDKAEYIFEMLKEAQGSDPASDISKNKFQANKINKSNSKVTATARTDVNDPGRTGAVSVSPKQKTRSERKADRIEKDYKYDSENNRTSAKSLEEYRKNYKG